MDSKAKDRRGVWFCSTLSTHLSLHEHGGPELNLLMSGSLTYQIGETTTRVRAGELLVIEAGVSHQILEASRDAAFWVIEMESKDALSWFSKSKTHLVETEWVRHFVSVVRKLWLRPSGTAERTLWNELFSVLRASPPVGAERSIVVHPAVKRARAICQSELEGDLTMTTLSKRAGISASRLSHLFQEQLGITPLQYRNFCRVQYFIQRHGESGASLMRAALRAGFGSYPQFHRTFQQVCGAPPAAHLERLLADSWTSPDRTLPSSSVA